MIKPRVVVIDRDKGAWMQLLKDMKVKEARVTVGVHDQAGDYTEGNNPPSVAEVAFWNEFGTQRTPERSFIRSTVDENVPRIQSLMTLLFERIIASASKSDLKFRGLMMQSLTTIGFQMKTLIENKIKSNVPPPNAASTVERKEAHGSLNPRATLRDTELLLRSITYQEELK